MAEPISITGLDVDDRRRLVLRLSREPNPDWKSYFSDRWKDRTQPGGSARYAVYISWEDNTIHLAGMSVADFEERHKEATMEAVRTANEKTDKADARRHEEAARAQETKERLDSELEAEKARARSVKFE